MVGGGDDADRDRGQVGQDDPAARVAPDRNPVLPDVEELT
jgi:hypothetical protein